MGDEVEDDDDLLAALREDASIDAEIDDKENSEDKDDDGDDTNDYDLHRCQESPENCHFYLKKYSEQFWNKKVWEPTSCAGSFVCNAMINSREDLNWDKYE